METTFLLVLIIFQLSGVVRGDHTYNCEESSCITVNGQQDDLEKELTRMVTDKLLEIFPAANSAESLLTFEILGVNTECGRPTKEETSTAQPDTSTREISTEPSPVMEIESCDHYEDVCGGGNLSCTDNRFIHIYCNYGGGQDHKCFPANTTVASIFAQNCQLKKNCSLVARDFGTPCDKNKSEIVCYRCIKKDAAVHKLHKIQWYNATNGMWYKLYNKTRKYEVAKDKCRSKGGRLASSGLRNSTIRNELANTVLSNVSKGEQIWIGARKIGNESVWSDGEPLASGWDIENDTHSNENCIVFSDVRKKKLIDISCGKSLKYICEIDLD